MPFVQHSVPWVITTKQISGKWEDVQEGPFQEIARGFFKTTVLDEEKASKSQWGEGYFNILTADKGYQGTFTYNGGVFPGKEPHNRSGTFVPHGRGTLMAYEGNGIHRTIFDGEFNNGYGRNSPLSACKPRGQNCPADVRGILGEHDEICALLRRRLRNSRNWEWAS